MARLRNALTAGVCGAAVLCSSGTAEPATRKADPPAKDTAVQSAARWVKARTLKEGVDSVVAAGPRQVWVFNSRLTDDDGLRPSAYRWDGRRWRRFPLPPGVEGMVFHVAARSAGEVWAAVDSDGEYRGSPALLRWNGVKWSLARKLDGMPIGLAVWGKNRVQVTVSGNDSPMYLLRWEGKRWTRTVVKGEYFLDSLVTKAGVGWALSGGGDDLPQLLRSSHGRWHVVSLGKALPRPKPCPEDPDPRPCGETNLSKIAATSSGALWVLGHESTRTGDPYTPVWRNFLLYGHVGSWKAVKAPQGFDIEKIISDGGQGVWVVGFDGDYRLAAAHVTSTGTWGPMLPLPEADKAVSWATPFARAPNGHLWLGVIPTTDDSSGSVWTLKP